MALLAFVLVLGIFSYYMDAKCDFYQESCRDLFTINCTVIRAGVLHEIDEQHVVVGDLLFFRTGEKIAADIKLVECSAVRINPDMLNDCQQHYYTKLYGNKCDLERFFRPGELFFNTTYIYGGK